MTWLLPDAVLTPTGLEEGLAVQIVDDRIAQVRPFSVGDEAERLRGKLLLPGFVNAHSHAFQRALRGHVQHGTADGRDSFWTWREAMYGLAETLNPDAVERIATLAFREMLAAGYTTVGEFHYLHHQPNGDPYDDPEELSLRIVSAARVAGIRLVLLYVAYARAGHGLAPNPRQRRFIHPSSDAVLAAVERLRAIGARTGFDVGLAPHSVRACPADWLRDFSTYKGIIHAHVDEQPAEVQASLAEYGRRPVEVYAEAGILSPRFSAVHLTHPDDREIDLFARHGGSVVACPTTELDLGDGFLPIQRLDGRVPVCIGSDSHASIDPFAELRAIEWHARALSGHRNVVQPAACSDPADGLAVRLLQMGSQNGAKALGVDTGTLEPGRFADIIAVDASRLEFAHARLLPAIVFNGSPAAVSDVWVGGRRVKTSVRR